MSRSGAAVLAASLLSLGGCFSAQGGAEANRDRVQMGMSREEVRSRLGAPKDAHPIPGQGASEELPVEQWCYQWNYPTGKTLTVLLTAFIGLFFMDFSPYGFDVGFGRDGRVHTISEVGRRRR